MKQRRTQLVVDGNFQYRLVLIGILVSFILINTTLISGFLVSDLVIFDASPQVIFSFTVGLTEIVCLVIVFLISLRSSHRIAGPLYVIGQNLKRIGEGDLAIKTRLRKTDHFQDLGAQLTQTTEQLCGRFRQLKETTEMLVSQLDDDSIAAETVQRLRTQLSEFNTGLDEDDHAVEVCELSSAQLDK